MTRNTTSKIETDTTEAQPTPDTATRANAEHIHGNTWVVRTQAGFKRVLKDFIRADHEGSVQWNVGRARGYPTVYPSVVTFTWGYRGYEYVCATCIPINLVKLVIDRH